MKAPLSYVPALPAAIGMTAGIVIYYAGGSWIWCLLPVIVALAIARLRLQWGVFVCIFVSLGWLLSEIGSPAQASDGLLNKKAWWSGEVEAIRTSPGSTRLRIKVDKVSLDKKAIHDAGDFSCSILLPSSDRKYQCGDIVAFEAKMQRPDMRTDLPDENSYNPTYFIDGVTAEAFVSPDDIETIGESNSLRRIAGQWHEELKSLIYLSPVNDRTAWFLSATLLGDDSMLDPGVKQEFRATGVAHYLALSGFHVGIIAMLAGLLLFPLKTWSRAGRYRHLIVIALIWLYAFVCGMSASLVRAATLITIFLCAKIVGRQSSPYNSLAVAAIAILAFSPRQLFAPGFQMSFAAVASILIFAPKINPFRRRDNIRYRAAEFIAVPVAAMLGTCLVTMVHFHRFPLLFLLPNLLLGVLMPLMLGAGLLMMFFTAFGLRLTLLGSAVNFCYDTVEKFCDSLARLPYSEISGIFLPPTAIFSGISALLLLAMALKFRKRYMAFLFIAASMIAIGSTALEASPAETELFVTRQPLRTDVIVRNGQNCRLLTSAHEKDHNAIARQLSRRYNHYLKRRKCGDSIVVANTNFDLNAIKRVDDYIIIGRHILMTAFSPSLMVADGLKVNYLLISRSAGTNPEKIIEAVRPDTVLIAADMPPKRATALKAWCHSNDIPTTDLRNAPFHLSEP